MTWEPLSLTRRQRWTLTWLISGMVAIGAADVWGDLAEGSGLVHMAVELVAISLGSGAIAWIWIETQRLDASRVALSQRLELAQAEAKAWRTRAQDHLRGLGKALDDQFQQWSLTAAEKEVALLLLKGLSLKEIGTARGTAERTTRQQAQEVYRKSGLGGRAEFAAFFLEDLLLPKI